MWQFTSGEFWLRGSIWLALAAGVTALGLRRTMAVAWAWRVGAGWYLVHVAAAFQFRHGWSHVTATEATARQTAAVTGWNLGAGIWVNYAFTAAWVVVAARWPCLAPGLRRGWIIWFLFMTVNGAVIFVSGPERWVGIVLTTLALAAVFRPGAGTSGSRPAAVSGGGRRATTDRHP